MVETINSFSTDKLEGWIFEMLKKEFEENNEIIDGNTVPTENFFKKRKNRLIDFFKRVANNQKYSWNS